MKTLFDRRIKITLNGTVQGVGFRPAVFRAAHKQHLTGWVANTSRGLIIEVQGAPRSIDSFLDNLLSAPPPRSHIEKVTVSSLTAKKDNRFRILPSLVSVESKARVTPDISICSQCRQELFCPPNRRYLYPFINCTDCGPRFTIVKAIPYDRKNTTMAKFAMCSPCQDEYTDPASRRFHAQPNACPQCGPRLELTSARSGTVTGSGPAAFEKTVTLLSQGKIIAIKGLGGFHLACSALNEKAVTTLRKRKYREDKPFALMAADITIIRRFCRVSPQEKDLLLSPARPIVLLRKRPHCTLPQIIAPKNRYLGMMLPYTPLHYLLFGSPEKRYDVLVMTSGNISDEPIAYRDQDAFCRLAGIADYFLSHNRAIHTRCDDSVTRIIPITKTEYVLRRSRGYAPAPLPVNYNFTREILACGAQLKNTFALAREKEIYLSHHIGDLENWETLQAFTEGIEHYKKLFHFRPRVIAYDLHPEYLASKYAHQQIEKKLYLRAVGVQHHHAHIVSCMADNNLTNRKVIGIAWDGTGFGEDGCLWGSEFMVSDFNGYQRRAHLDYIPLPGGVRAIEEPWRLAAVYLYRAYGSKFTSLKIDFTSRLDKTKWPIIESMIANKINSPLSSGMGRLFDAVSSLLGILDKINYPGQAAVELELASAGEKNPHPGNKYYRYNLKKEKGIYIIDVIPLIHDIVDNLQRGISPSVISAVFHKTIAGIAVEVCQRISHDTGIREITLSGGVFQNMILLDLVYRSLIRRGFTVYIHRRVPAGDGGTALGQAVIANSQKGDNSAL